MARKRIEVEAGSGNVFADLGYPDARERSLKVELAMEVNRILAARGLAQERAARLLKIRQPHVSDLVRYRLNRFSVERYNAQQRGREGGGSLLFGWWRGCSWCCLGQPTIRGI